MARAEIGRATVHFRGLEGKPLARVIDQLQRLEVVDRPLRHIVLDHARLQRVDTLGLSEWEGGVVDAAGETPEFARLQRAGVECLRPRRDGADVRPRTELDVAILGGMSFAGYGHILLESLARIWAAGLEPAAPIVFLQKTRNAGAEDILAAALDLLGIDPGRLLFLEGDAVCRRLIVPEPGVRLEMSINRRHFDALAGRLARRREAPATAGPPIYLSRSRLTVHHRRPFGETSLEQALEGDGHRIIHPELLPLAEQAQLFDQSDRFAGFIGSQFHNLLFRLRPDPLQVVYFCGDTPNPNFLLLDALFAGERHYVKATTFAPLFEFGNRAPFCVDFDVIRDCCDILGADRGHLDALVVDAASQSAFVENWFENYFHHKIMRLISLSPNMPESERLGIFSKRMDRLMRADFDGPQAALAVRKFKQILEPSGLLPASATQSYREALQRRV
ncbi:MAG: glycosyltransferase family 61 protein [Methylocystis sp.]|uniref:glycosyltransferase family 61 protein n=1 Tax=Methylocystis sp. TaxID=1911079 RepID=UPI003DA546F8